MGKLFLFIAVLFVLPQLSFASSITENFDSYTNGASLGGANGGSGWGGAWTVGGDVIAPWTSDTAPAGGQGGLALHTSTTLCCNPNTSRTFTPISSGTLHYQFNFSDGAAGTVSHDHVVHVILNDSANTGGAANIHRIDITLNLTGAEEVGAGDGQSYNTMTGTFTTNTWNTVDIKFDNALGNVFQVSVNGGPYSGNFSSGGSLAHIDTFLVFSEETSPNDFWVDDISIAPPAPPVVNTINRLAKFITNITIGDALFSDDGTNTTLTSGNLFLQIGSLIDTVTSGVLNFGTTMASAITIGRIGMTTTLPGTVAVGKMTTVVNCNSSVSPAVCDGAPAGSVALGAGDTTLVVNTTAVTANSQIFVTEDSSLGAHLGVTCNTATNRSYRISARTPGTNFTIRSNSAPAQTKACLSYWVVN